jgi:predicted DNA-binding transcriptional regulator AlpA
LNTNAAVLGCCVLCCVATYFLLAGTLTCQTSSLSGAKGKFHREIGAGDLRWLSLQCLQATSRAIFSATDDSASDILFVLEVGYMALQTIEPLPETGFVRLSQILTMIPLGKTSWWKGVKSGRFPKPVKLSERCTAWRAEDIRELIKSLADCPQSK